MTNIMKSSVNKVVIVKINKKTHQVTVDSSVFDNIFIEAATQVVEKYKKDMTFFNKICIIGEAYLKENKEKIVEHYQVNLYHILLNAGFYSMAELLRQKTKDLHNVDLKFEPVIANAGKNPNP